MTWTRRDELTYRLYLKAAHAAVAAIPEDRQFHPIAQQARTHWSDLRAVEPIVISAP